MSAPLEKLLKFCSWHRHYKYPVAKDFENVYNYLMERLLEANLKKDKEILEEVLTHLRTMRDTWKEVMEQNKTAKAN